MDRPKLDFTDDFERNFKLLNAYEQWYSWQVHQDENDLLSVVYQMLWRPDLALPEL